MGRYDNTKRNQYNSTPRKVFDAYIDRMAVKRQRDNENHINDIKLVLHRMVDLEKKLTHVEELMNEYHPVSDLEQLPDGRWRRKHGTEEL